MELEGNEMTAEKHPLETVRHTLQESARGCSAIELIAPNIKDARQYASMMKTEIDQALTALTTYMGQTQSCAECERLGRENALLREVVRDFAGGIAESDCFNLDKLLQKHAATIAAAGGE